MISCHPRYCQAWTLLIESVSLSNASLRALALPAEVVGYVNVKINMSYVTLETSPSLFLSIALNTSSDKMGKRQKSWMIIL